MNDEDLLRLACPLADSASTSHGRRDATCCAALGISAVNVTLDNPLLCHEDAEVYPQEDIVETMRIFRRYCTFWGVI